MNEKNVSTVEPTAPEMKPREFLFPLDEAENAMVRVMGTPAAPLFCALDVCTVLGLTNSREAIAKLDEDEKGVSITDTLGGRQQMQFVTESGLYHLVFKSRKAAAKRFRRWVTGTVLPALRRGEPVSGAAITGPSDEDLLSLPQWLAMVKLDPTQQLEACLAMFRCVERAAKHMRYVHKSAVTQDGYQRFPLAVLKYAAAIFVKEMHERSLHQQGYAMRVAE